MQSTADLSRRCALLQFGIVFSARTPRHSARGLLRQARNEAAGARARLLRGREGPGETRGATRARRLLSLSNAGSRCGWVGDQAVCRAAKMTASLFLAAPRLFLTAPLPHLHVAFAFACLCVSVQMGVLCAVCVCVCLCVCVRVAPPRIAILCLATRRAGQNDRWEQSRVQRAGRTFLAKRKAVCACGSAEKRGGAGGRQAGRQQRGRQRGVAASKVKNNRDEAARDGRGARRQKSKE